MDSEAQKSSIADRQRITVLELEVASLKRALKAAQNNAALSESRLDLPSRSSRDLNDANALIAQLRHELAIDSANLEKEALKYSDLHGRHVTMTTELHESISILRKEVTVHVTTIEVHKTENSDLKTLIERLEFELQMIAKLTAENETLKAKIADLEKLLAASKENERKSQHALELSKNTIKDLENDKSLLEKKLSHLQRELDEAKKDFASQMIGLKSLHSQSDRVKELTDEVTTLRTAIDGLNRQLIDMKKLNEQLKVAANEANERSAVLKDELDIANETVADLTDDVAKANREVGKVRQTVIGLEERVVDKTKKLAVAEETIAHLHKSLDVANSRLTA